MSVKYKHLIAIVVLIIGVVALPAIVLAATKTAAASRAKPAPKPPHYVRIFYYQNGSRAHTSFVQHLSSIDVVAPQTYSLDSAGSLHGSVPADLLTLAKQHRIKVMPLVTNTGFSRSGVAAFLHDPEKQDAAIAALVNEAVKKKFWGWQVDFEQIDAADRDQFSAFIKNFNDALHLKHLVLSVAVIAQHSDNPDDYPKNSWQNVVGAYDYTALGSNSDFLSIMSYDDPWSKGPVARFTWDEQVIQYALRFVPAAKLSLGIPLYYWQWNDVTGKRVGVGGYHGIQNTLQKHKVARGYDTVEQAAFIHYTSQKTPYTIWYDNAQSVKKKVELIRKYQLNGFSAWALGLESPDIYSAVKE